MSVPSPSPAPPRLPPAAAPGKAMPRAGGLVIVATPIGNLDDFSPRAQATLAAADLILCEDTRVSRKLLARYGIAARLQSFTDHTAASERARHVARMRAGAAIALISDAGTPLLSDPGQALVAEAIAAGITVSIVPGPAASIAALAISGLPVAPHLFLGFLAAKASAARRMLAPVLAAEQAGLAATLVLYEAPQRLAATLALLAELLGARAAVVVRELTKRFEEVRRGSLPELAHHYAGRAVKGEITLVIAPAPAELPDHQQLPALLRQALAELGMREAVDAVARASGLPKRAVYRAALALKSADQAGKERIQPDQA